MTKLPLTFDWLHAQAREWSAAKGYVMSDALYDEYVRLCAAERIECAPYTLWSKPIIVVSSTHRVFVPLSAMSSL